ncbi:similar to Saccharomyces cerevisiae YBR255W MTC4 Protein of unknown function, required for normal growth rate at 15 degrees C [Maudiozyma saulgeensis]|uniref:Maintenance of telomere capping protein 4 n=1 Tax=Maudiozyma saulgeensis TaxID=1789683 RepID=A0A1X7R362_9SACH|nr:similar to Saccharomyces cerevisiae YBR255W MTC4 Protein of unknown function, required for normal growth rate at 15 degrees C [Kazachstania saulgeensis]
MVESYESDSESLEGKKKTEQSTNNNSRRVKLVTKLFLDMNSGLMDDLNYDRDVDKKYDGETNNDRRSSRGNDADSSIYDDENNENREYGSLIPMAEQHTVPKISKTTRLRAERVRIYLDYYYNVIEGTLRSGEDENGNERKNIHKNVEGIYNPLQIIRNRKLKKKYRGETASSGFLFYKAPIIAVIQFSKIPNRKNYKWFVDVNEKYADITFRSQHWDELVDPTGHKWFGTQKTHRFRSEAHKIKKNRGSTHINGHLHHNHKKNNGKSLLLRDSDQSSDSILNKVPKLIVTTDHSDPNLGSRTSSNSNGISSYSSDGDKVNYNERLMQTVSDSEIEDGSSKEKDGGHLNKFEKILNKTKNSKRWSRSKSPSKIRSEENNNGSHESKKDITKIVPQEFELGQDDPNSNEAAHRGSVSGPSGKDNYNTYQTPVEGTAVKKLSLLDDIPIRTVKGHSAKKLNVESPELTAVSSGSYKYDNEIKSIENKRGIKDDDIQKRLTVENTETVIKNKNLNVLSNNWDNSKSGSSKEATPFSKRSSTNAFDELPVDIQLQKYWQDTRYVISTIAIMEHRRQSHDLVRQRAIHRRNLIKVDENTEKNMADTEKIIKEYDEGLDRVLKIGNNWTSKLLNDYSIRVETLISASDRILSDINTTLTLKLKLFQENTDRFGTIRTMQSQKMTKSIYKILEFFIVLVLWSIWLVVSIVREIKFSIMLVLRFIKWVLW